MTNFNERIEVDEIGCHRQRMQNKMENGELLTFALGAFAVLLVAVVVVYYKCIDRPPRKRFY